MPLIICQQYGGHQEQKSLLQFIRLFLSMRVVWPRDGRGSFIHSNKLIFLVDPIQSLLKFGSCRGNSFVHWMYHISSGSDYHWHAYKQFMVAHTCKRSAAVYNWTNSYWRPSSRQLHQQQPDELWRCLLSYKRRTNRLKTFWTNVWEGDEHPSHAQRPNMVLPGEVQSSIQSWLVSLAPRARIQ